MERTAKDESPAVSGLLFRRRTEEESYRDGPALAAIAKVFVDRSLVVILTVIAREAALLARYAMHSADSRGRKHAEAEHPYRGPFQRGRDRIGHFAAFRRPRRKMQVFTGAMGDYHRTRLTHTHEVASIART